MVLNKDTFKEDLPIGEEAELMVLNMIQDKYPTAYKIQGHFKYYDIYVPETGMRIEVKRDIGSNKSSNFFIEYNCNGYDSGIMSSRSDYYVIFDENKFIWIRTDKLKSISELYGRKWKGTPIGGCSPVKAFLLDKNYVLKFSELITTLHESSN